MQLWGFSVLRVQCDSCSECWFREWGGGEELTCFGLEDALTRVCLVLTCSVNRGPVRLLRRRRLAGHRRHQRGVVVAGHDAQSLVQRHDVQVERRARSRQEQTAAARWVATSLLLRA